MKKISTKALILSVAAVILLAGAGVFAMDGKKDSSPASAPAPAAGGKVAPAASTPSDDMTFDTASLPKDPMGERTLGDPKAPVHIEEFASLTCGHCAHFENDTFPEFKKKYIDTGKVFYTFTDFPLNGPALDAAVVARCLPPERYFPFIVMLFGSQNEWAFTNDYKTALKQYAGLAGLAGDAFDACLANKKLKEGIVQTMQQRGKANGIDSTPSFMINGTLLKGALPINEFDDAIASALQKKAPVAAPDTKK